eukprot:2751976-Alexandrium_andersonii.AAC.1
MPNWTRSRSSPRQGGDQSSPGPGICQSWRPPVSALRCAARSTAPPLLGGAAAEGMQLSGGFQALETTVRP